MPVSLIPAGLQTVGGIAQSIFGGRKEKKAEDALEALQTPTYSGSKSILDYYNKSLQRYGINPFQSDEYNYDTQNASRNTAAGINALQSRGGAVGGISRLVALNNDANIKAGITAKNRQDAAFNDLGNAANMQTGDDRYRFQINDIMPYEKQYSLLAAKAGGGANMLNSGLSNIFGGLSNASMVLDDDDNSKYTNNGYNNGGVQYGTPPWKGYS